MGDRIEGAVEKLENGLLAVDGVEGSFIAVYTPGRPGGEVAISINQGTEGGMMNPKRMLQFVDVILGVMRNYRKRLRSGDVH